MQLTGFPSVRYDTHVVIPVRVTGAKSGDVEGWSAEITEAKRTKLCVKISSPPDCLIGRYKMFVSTKVGGIHDFRFSLEDRIFVLFNPWCKGTYSN